MRSITPVITAVIHRDGKFLLTERAYHHDSDIGQAWHFPGGQLEFGEELQDGLKREIQEELNLTIIVERQLPVFTAILKTWQGVFIPHLCSIDGEFNITLDHESLQYNWFTLEEIKKLKTLSFVVEMAEEAEKALTQG